MGPSTQCIVPSHAKLCLLSELCLVCPELQGILDGTAILHPRRDTRYLEQTFTDANCGVRSPPLSPHTSA